MKTIRHEVSCITQNIKSATDHHIENKIIAVLKEGTSNDLRWTVYDGVQFPISSTVDKNAHMKAVPQKLNSE